MQRIAVFPGTFDPITIGHVDIINRSLGLFDKVVIGIGRNVNKLPMFSEEEKNRLAEKFIRIIHGWMQFYMMVSRLSVASRLVPIISYGEFVMSTILNMKKQLLT